MTEFVYSVMYTPAWELINMLLVMLGMAGIVALLFGLASTRRGKLIAWSAIGLLLLVIVVSMLFEEILPAWSTLPEARRLPYALSFVGFLVFVVMFIHSASVLLRGGLFTQVPRLVRGGPERAEALGILRPGLLWFAASATVFALSLLGYHGLDVIMGRTVAGTP